MNEGKRTRKVKQRVGSLADKRLLCATPDETFEAGREIGAFLCGGEAVLLTGPLGAGKTLLTKGILKGLGFDPNEVNSPSFTLINRYEARLPVYHIDLWRVEGSKHAVHAVGLDELAAEKDAILVIEWAEHLGVYEFPGRVIKVIISGDGSDPRTIDIGCTGFEAGSV